MPSGPDPEEAGWNNLFSRGPKGYKVGSTSFTSPIDFIINDAERNAR
jgi:hypothetical protein